MIYIQPKSMDCAFHFAAEEYVMSALCPTEPALMLWRTDRTVMIGANQIAEIEADLPYVREHDIAVVRRSSGGGTIYTDPGTLLYTIILPYANASATSLCTVDTAASFTATDPKSVIKDYLAGPVISTLAGMGVSADLEGRNDILVSGRKISGIAQYIKYGYLCSHGSLLFDADLAELVRVLTVDDEKILSKALRSIRSRVTNTSEHLPKNGTSKSVSTITDFINALRKSWNKEFGLTNYKFTKADLAHIEKKRAEKYGANAWTFGHTPRYSFRNSKRFAGGGIEIFAEVKNGIIESVKITGDFLALKPIGGIEKKLNGRPFRADALEKILTENEVSDTLGSITKDELLSVFE